MMERVVTLQRLRLLAWRAESYAFEPIAVAGLQVSHKVSDDFRAGAVAMRRVTRRVIKHSVDRVGTLQTDVEELAERSTEADRIRFAIRGGITCNTVPSSANPANPRNLRQSLYLPAAKKCIAAAGT